MRLWNNWRNRLFVVAGLLSLALVLSMGFGGGNYASAGLPASVAASGASSSALALDKTAPNAPVSCADIARLGIDKQMNMHAAEILTACAQGKTSQAIPAMPAMGRIAPPTWARSSSDHSPLGVRIAMLSFQTPPLPR